MISGDEGILRQSPHIVNTENLIEHNLLPGIIDKSAYSGNIPITKMY